MPITVINVLRKRKVLWLFFFWLFTGLWTGYLICFFQVAHGYGLWILLNFFTMLNSVHLCMGIWSTLIMEFISCTCLLRTESSNIEGDSNSLVPDCDNVLFIRIEESLTIIFFLACFQKRQLKTLLCLVLVKKSPQLGAKLSTVNRWYLYLLCRY